MSHWLDNAAVELATGRGMTRRQGLRRAAAILVLSGPLAAIAGAKHPAVAIAQETEACTQCHRKNKSATAWGFRLCAKAFLGTVWTPYGGLLSVACHYGNIADYAATAIDCEADVCGRPPPPKGSGCTGGKASQLEGDGRHRALAAAATCTLVPPTPAPTTTPPPTGGCTNACEQVGGICCGPYTTINERECVISCTSCQNGPC